MNYQDIKQIELIKDDLSIVCKELNSLQATKKQLLNTVNQQIRKHSLYVTNHAIIRYIERIDNVNIQEIKDNLGDTKEITEHRILEYLRCSRGYDIDNVITKILKLNKEKFLMLGAGRYSNDYCTVVITSNSVVTVLPLDNGK